MPQLDPTFFASQIFWLFVTFVVLYVIVAKAAVPRIGGILQSRQDRIANDLDRAESLKKEAEKIEAQYRASLESTKARANAIIANSNAEMDKISKQKHGELDHALAKKGAEAEARIKDARNKAVSEIQTVASEISQLIVKQVAGITVPGDKAEQAVKRMMKEV